MNGSVTQTQNNRNAQPADVERGNAATNTTPLLADLDTPDANAVVTGNDVTVHDARPARHPAQKRGISKANSSIYEEIRDRTPSTDHQSYDEADQAYEAKHGTSVAAGDNALPTVTATTPSQSYTTAVQADVHTANNDDDTRSHHVLYRSKSAPSVSGVGAIPIHPRPFSQRTGGGDEIQSRDVSEQASSVSPPQSSVSPERAVSVWLGLHNAVAHARSTGNSK